MGLVTESGEVRKAAVIGAGLMGHGIALELARFDVAVSLWDEAPPARDAAPARVHESAASLEQVGVASAGTAERVSRNLTVAGDLEAAIEDTDLVMEAVSESLPVKQHLFRRLAAATGPSTILASNTSTFLPSALIEELAPEAHHERILVAHYFNPPHLLPAVELVPHASTDESVVATMTALYVAMGKQPVVLRREVPGFVANRLQQALLREAASLVESGVVGAAELDALVAGSFGRRLAVAGPFTVSDLAGLDVIGAIAHEIWPQLASGAEVAPSLRQRADAGQLGAKTGSGFFEWDEEGVRATRDRIARALVAVQQPA